MKTVRAFLNRYNMKSSNDIQQVLVLFLKTNKYIDFRVKLKINATIHCFYNTVIHSSMTTRIGHHQSSKEKNQ